MKKINLGIIPDGNRRYAKRNNLKYDNLIDLWNNQMILKNIKEYLDNSSKYYEKLKQIKSLSLYVSSIENVNRTDGTATLTYDLIRKIHSVISNKKDYFTEEQLDKLYKLNINFKLNIVGEIHLIPKDIIVIIDEWHQYSRHVDDCFVVTLAVAYDYKKDLENYGVNNNKNYTREQSMIDCIIRTGNEFRLSGFFPIHSVYSEFVFFKKLWPEFNIGDIINVVDIFNKRERRFGK